MVWLIPVIVRWPDIGRAGRLRRSDLLRAACLGAACATQQLAWFVAPFLLVGLFALRRGELPARRAFGTVASFAGVAGVDVPRDQPAVHRSRCAGMGVGGRAGPDPARHPAWPGTHRRVVLPDRRQRRAGLLLVRDPAAGSGHAGRHGDLDPPPGTCPDRDPVAGVLPVRSLTGRLLPADDAALARGGRDRAAIGLRTRLAAADLRRRRDRSGASRPADRAACRASRLARCSQRASSRRHSCARRSRSRATSRSSLPS